MQNPIITPTEGVAVLELVIACFECGANLRKPIRAFVVRNYTREDFIANGVNPESFEDWLNS